MSITFKDLPNFYIQNEVKAAINLEAKQIKQLDLNLKPEGNAEISSKYGVLITVNGLKFGVLEKNKEFSITHNGMPQSVESVDRIKSSLKNQIEILENSINISNEPNERVLEKVKNYPNQHNLNQELNIMYLDAYNTLLKYFETKHVPFGNIIKKELNYMRDNYS